MSTKSNLLMNKFLQKVEDEKRNPLGDVKIKLIDVKYLVNNENNYYRLNDIPQLAGLIEKSKIIEPLTVVPINPDSPETPESEYKIISGHRRCAAVKYLLEQHTEGITGKVPCVIKEFKAGDATTVEDEELLMLIASNKGQREYRTIDEQIWEIDQLSLILDKEFKKKKEKGTLDKECRFRDYLAQFLNISSSKLQRLQSLKKLIPDAKDYLDKGIISQSAAVYLAKLTDEEQEMVLVDISDEDLNVINIKKYIENMHKDESSEDGEEIEEIESEVEAEEVDCVQFEHEEKKSTEPAETDIEEISETDVMEDEADLPTEVETNAPEENREESTTEAAAYSPEKYSWDVGHKFGEEAEEVEQENEDLVDDTTEDKHSPNVSDEEQLEENEDVVVEDEEVEPAYTVEDEDNNVNESLGEEVVVSDELKNLVFNLNTKIKDLVKITQDSENYEYVVETLTKTLDDIDLILELEKND